MNDPATSAPGLGRPEEARAFLERNPDIEAVQLVITDANGVGRGKNVAREELDALYGPGRNVAGSILGLDVTGVSPHDCKRLTTRARTWRGSARAG